jgi:hypothetical protein
MAVLSLPVIKCLYAKKHNVPVIVFGLSPPAIKVLKVSAKTKAL